MQKVISHKQSSNYLNKWLKQKENIGLVPSTHTRTMHAIKMNLNELNMNIIAQRRNISTYYAANHQV